MFCKHSQDSQTGTANRHRCFKPKHNQEANMMEIDTTQHVTKSNAQTEGAEHSLDICFFLQRVTR